MTSEEESEGDPWVNLFQIPYVPPRRPKETVETESTTSEEDRDDA